MSTSTPAKIVVVGGGAGGLELATRLGKKLGKKRKAEITLVDAYRTHVWKPLLHQIAAGASDTSDHALEYLAQAHWHGFSFRLGHMDGIDREAGKIWLSPVNDANGNEIVGRRSIDYDKLVLAVGSEGNDFGIEGVTEHCLMLDDKQQAVDFQTRLLNHMLRANTQPEGIRPGQLDVAIVGAGATGVELAAQLHFASRQAAQYGLNEIDPDAHMRISVIEAGPRILPALPERLAENVTQELSRLQIKVHVNTRVSKLSEEGITTEDGGFLPAAIKVWTAGIKAPAFLSTLGLTTNGINQIEVRPTLQSIDDENIFALGDCAACRWGDTGTNIPPRAQAAHQQASYLACVLPKLIQGQAAPGRAFTYRDYGSLVTLGRYSTVGSLMGSVTGSVRVSGYLARMVYLSLYKSHQIALHGVFRTVLMTLASLLRRTVDPPIKLH